MKTLAKSFRFHAKQGQHGEVCRLLTASVGKPRCKATEEGVMIQVNLPIGTSKRMVDRMLHAAGIPGASSRRNKYPVIKGSRYEVIYHKKASELFQWVDETGKFRGLHRYGFFDMGCECCSYHTLINKDGNRAD